MEFYLSQKFNKNQKHKKLRLNGSLLAYLYVRSQIQCHKNNYHSHYLLMFCMKNRQFENMSKIATTKLFSVLRKCSLETDVCDRFNIYGGSVR